MLAVLLTWFFSHVAMQFEVGGEIFLRLLLMVVVPVAGGHRPIHLTSAVCRLTIVFYDASPNFALRSCTRPLVETERNNGSTNPSNSEVNGHILTCVGVDGRRRFGKF